MERREDILLQNLKSGCSVFQVIPDDIGEIVYCDSSNPKAEADSKGTTVKKIILSILIPSAIVAFCWLVFDKSPIIDSIVTVIAVIVGGVAVYECISFHGKDYFVGNEGAALYSFNKSRDDVTEEMAMHFRDFEDMLISETRRFKNGAYDGTEYSFDVYGHTIDDERIVIVHYADVYNQKKPEDYYTDQTFRFWKKVELYWTFYRLSQLKEDLAKGKPIGFNIYVNDQYFDNYIVFKGDTITIGRRTFHRENVKNVKFHNGELIIKGINDTQKFYGLIGNKDETTVALSSIGNRELFLRFFHYFASTL